MILSNKDIFSKLKRNIITPSANINESVLSSRLNKSDANKKITILKFVSTLKTLESSNFRIEYANNTRPKIPNLFNTCNRTEWGPDANLRSVSFIIFR